MLALRTCHVANIGARMPTYFSPVSGVPVDDVLDRLQPPVRQRHVVRALRLDPLPPLLVPELGGHAGGAHDMGVGGAVVRAGRRVHGGDGHATHKLVRIQVGIDGSADGK